MIIRSVKHKGLKYLLEKDSTRYLPSKYGNKIRGILEAIDDAETIADFLLLPKGNPHKLTGDRSDTYAISVYANWRITFIYDESDHSVHILDFEDYH